MGIKAFKPRNIVIELPARECAVDSKVQRMKPVETTTAASQTTTAGTDTAKKKGCGSSVVTAVLPMIAVLGIGVGCVARKKKMD